MKISSARWCILCLGLLLGGCDYEEGLTAKPTRKIDERFLGVWSGGDDGKELMTVRQLDDFHYIVAMDADIYRAFHSEFAGMDLLSVQELNGGRKYVFATAAVSANDRQLTVRLVSTKTVSDSIKGRSALQKAIKANQTNPALYADPVVFTRKK